MTRLRGRSLRDWLGATPPVYLPFRVAVSVTAVLLFNQAVFAGQFLSGTFEALATHASNANIAALAMLATVVTAGLIKMEGGPLWPTLASIGLALLVGVEMVLGLARVIWLHIPTGVALIALTALLVRWAWRPHPAIEPPAERR
jgi:hypothetical protein